MNRKKSESTEPNDGEESYGGGQSEIERMCEEFSKEKENSVC